MSWTSEHDIYLCREVILMEPFKYKPSTRERGLAWESIAQDLNAITGDITFNVNKRSVRDRYNLLVEHFKMKQREYAKASGIEVEETELDQLLLELTEKADEAKQVYDKLTAEKNVHAEAEKSAAQEQRQTAMESLGETKKRKQSDDEPTPRKSRNTGSDTISYLRERSDKELELRERELQQKNEHNKVFEELLLQRNSQQTTAQLDYLQQQLNNQQQHQQQQLAFQARVEQMFNTMMNSFKK